MFRDIGVKTLWDQRRALLAWTLGILALVGMYAGIYPSMSGSNAYDDIINQMPSALRDLFTAGTSTDFSSGPGYVYMELLSFMAPLLVLVYAIGAGASAVAGEEERHTLDLLLVAPVRRTRVVWQKFLALMAGVFLMAATMGVALVAFGAAAGMGLATRNVAAAMLHLALLGLVFGALALLIGAATGALSMARAVPALLAVVCYLVNGFATSVSWLHPLQKFSPFYQYLGHDPIRSGLSLAALLVSTVTVVALVVLGSRLFERRDLA